MAHPFEPLPWTRKGGRSVRRILALYRVLVRRSLAPLGLRRSRCRPTTPTTRRPRTAPPCAGPRCSPRSRRSRRCRTSFTARYGVTSCSMTRDNTESHIASCRTMCVASLHIVSHATMLILTVGTRSRAAAPSSPAPGTAAPSRTRTRSTRPRGLGERTRPLGKVYSYATRVVLVLFCVCVCVCGGGGLLCWLSLGWLNQGHV